MNHIKVITISISLATKTFLYTGTFKFCFGYFEINHVLGDAYNVKVELLLSPFFFNMN